MTNKELIKQEIERLKEHTAKCGYPGQGEFENGNREGRNWVCDKLLSFIDSLPEESSSEDLEEAASKYVREDFHERSRADFKAGAKWHENKMKEALQTEYEKGRFDMQQEMMKDAVYGYVSLCHDYPYRRSLVAIEDGLTNLKYAEKVKIIICKTEQQ